MSAQRSIGQVLAVLKSQFPDVSISKIRFLESEGLVSPERAASGYRKYSEPDVERLRYILRVQKEHYLPLKVIREHLDMMDRGMQPPEVEDPRPVPAPEASSTVTEPEPVPAAPGTAVPASTGPRSQRPLRLSRVELLRGSGLSEAALVELERQMIVVPRRGTGFYDRDALAIAMVARRLAEFGMDARHMRAFKMAADREAGLIEQAITPFQRRGAQGRNVSGDVVKLVGIAHSALLRTALER